MSREQWIRGALWLGAAVLLVWAWHAPGFRDAEGVLKGSFCLPMAVALALAGLGLCAGGPRARAALWLALALVGQALGLQLVEAGRFVGYQHYTPFSKLLESRADLLLLAGLALQASLVASGLRRLWPRVRAALRGVLSIPRWVAVALVFVVTSATLSGDVSRYTSELLFASFVQAVNLANLILVVAALRSRELEGLESKLSALLGSGNPAKSGLDHLAWLGGAWVTTVAVVLAIFSYERHPHIPDEVAYVYHARYFAEGMLSMPLPPVPEAFDVDLMHFEEDRWYSPFPPGWPAILAVGTSLGVPWLVNPILNGVNVLLAYLLVLGLYDRATARLVLFLLCASPWFIFMGMNFMSHTSTLTCALAAAVAVVRLQQSRRLVWAWLGGLAIGMASLIRPLDGVALSGVLGLCALGIRGQRARFAPLAILAIGAIAVAALALPYNDHLTGDPTYFPVIAYFDHYYEPGSMDMGFGPNRGLGWTGLDPLPGHGPIDVLVNGNLNLFSVNVELHGWSTGSLLLAALFLTSGRLRRSDWLVFTSVVLVVGLHSFYWFSGGPDFGARYWYLILPGCVVLSARGAQTLGERLEPLAPDLAARGVRLGVAAACLLALLAFVPWRAIDKYPHYRAMRPDVRDLAREHGFGRSLVLIRGKRHPDYASAMIYNAVDLQSAAPIFAWDRGPEIRARVVAAFPDRSVWIVNGPTITGRGFEVVAGPLPPEEFSARARQSSFETSDPAAAALDG